MRARSLCRKVWLGHRWWWGTASANSFTQISLGPVPVMLCELRHVKIRAENNIFALQMRSSCWQDTIILGPREKRLPSLGDDIPCFWGSPAINESDQNFQTHSARQMRQKRQEPRSQKADGWGGVNLISYGELQAEYHMVLVRA